VGISPEKPYDAAFTFLPCEPIHPLTADVVARFVSTTELEVSPEQLFAIFEDPEAWPRWAWPGIRHVEWTSPKPYGVGTTRTVSLLTGIKVYEDFNVWDAPHEMAFTFYGMSEEVFSRFGEHYKVDDLGDGRCRLTWTVAYDPIGGFGRVHRFLPPMMRIAFNSYMFWLRRYCRKLT
jgi:hypothetical protein